MNLEKGKIYSGTVKNITNFGAFVDVYNEEDRRDKSTGMVHISEVSDEYVKDIHDFLEEGQKVKIFVLGVNENNKYSFSIKKASKDGKADQNPKDNKDSRKSDDRFRNRKNDNRSSDKFSKENKKTDEKRSENDSFEAMMSRFKKISEDKMCDINRIRDRRNNSRRSK